ncbi:MAG TPA: diacylglycerol kinase family protein [Actinomycetes bacterium]|jgi:YegS/Rv2252/BmrU family lipid kinase|nr:diacylglycerol kinase family protein [Actinomycetota bacterium]HEX2159292.1 diacylglycerol kinase family protein [Actinomycetes bacterium]
MGRPKRVAVVFNPATGGGDTAGRKRDTQEALQGVGLEVLWLETTLEDPGQGLTAKALAEGVDLVMAQGGDGTVMACVTGLAGTEVPLAVLPGGTGNLLATNFDIPSELDEAVEVALEGDRVRLDVAAMEDDRFVVMGGIGFDAAMLRDADPRLKEHLGAVAYVLSGFKHLRRRVTRFQLRLDDRPPIERTGQGVLIGNLGRLQGGLPIMPDARPDDGLLDVAVLQTRTVLDWLTLATRVLLRRRRKDPQLEAFQARRVEIHCDTPQPVERDGDPADARDHLVVEVVPAALILCVPRAKGSTP